MSNIQDAADAVRLAYRDYAYDYLTQHRDAADYIQDQLKGRQLLLRPGTVITVESVMNAGFNGMQVGGYTASGDYRIGCYR